jgi:hypothetical protein
MLEILTTIWLCVYDYRLGLKILVRGSFRDPALLKIWGLPNKGLPFFIVDCLWCFFCLLQFKSLLLF